MKPAGPKQPPAVPPDEVHSRAFRRMEYRIAKTLLLQMLMRARLRITLVLGLSLLLWLGLYRLVREGFAFLRATIPQPIHDQVIRAIFNTFFLTLMAMLIFSSCIILYGSLFRSHEVAYLLTLPIRDERIFLQKFRQAVLLSGWGFLLLGSPMLVAYGIVNVAPWYFYAMLLPMMIAFVYVPVGIGAIICLEVMYRLPRKRAQAITLSVIILVALLVWFLWSMVSIPHSDLLTPHWFQDMLRRLELTEKTEFPSWWLSAGLLETAGRAWAEGMLFLTLMISNALFFRQLAIWIAGRYYRKAYSLAASDGSLRTRVRLPWIDRFIRRSLGFLPLQIRLMMIKDLRIFRRDPIQWTQFVILFGLLFLYFLNVHPFSDTLTSAGWVSMVSFMNLAVVGLLASTFTTRFIFPMLSLEGRRFWLLGLLPLRRESILWSKFLFAIGSLLIPCSLLILLSDSMLRVSLAMVVNHQLTCVLLCFGLSGIAVGLGAKLPDLREQSPSRIAAGFGGTLNLVISTIYILAVMMLLTLPCHFYIAASAAAGALPMGDFSKFGGWLKPWLIGGTIGSVFLGISATAIPLWIGMRAFRRLEF